MMPDELLGLRKRAFCDFSAPCSDEALEYTLLNKRDVMALSSEILAV